MCLVLIAWRVHTRYPLVVAANRDEYYARPTDPAHRWPTGNGVIAGRDLEAGGSWMGVDATGRFAAVTNFRELEKGPVDARSRGELVSSYLLDDVSADSFLVDLAGRADRYRGFNLLLKDGDRLYCASNRDVAARELPPGFHGVSNGPLDSDWPKVNRGLHLLADAIACTEPDPAQLIALLRDRTQPADAALPDTGIGLELERLLGTVAIDASIDGKGYGTRSISVLLLDELGRGKFVESSRNDDASWQQRAFVVGSD